MSIICHMPKNTKTKHKSTKSQVAVRLEPAMIEALDKRALEMSVAGSEYTRSDLIRMAVSKYLGGR